MMNWIVTLYGFLSVLMHGLVLGAQSLTLGGVLFLLVVLSPMPKIDDSIRASILRWIRRWALLLAGAEIIYVALDIAILMQSGGFALSAVMSANFVLAGLLSSTSALAIAVMTTVNKLRRRVGLLLPSSLILTSAVMTSHAIARLDHRLPLGVLTGAHQAATAAWVGGLPYLLISLKLLSSPEIMRELCAKFSRLAMFSVGVLVAAGFGLARAYVGSWDATYGTTYGIMVAGKVVLFGMLLSLGALNFRIVRQRLKGAGSSLRLLQHFGEVEIGVGFTVILLAASLTSLPPAADIPQPTLPDMSVAERLAPHWPPPIIPPPTIPPPIIAESNAATHDNQLVPRLAALKTVVAETAIAPEVSGPSGALARESWMDDPHHWAALVVISVGVLALLAHSKRLRYARNWPLFFSALGLVLFLMADSQYWPLGADSFWNSFSDPIVLPHRIIEILITLFGVLEWRVQTQRVTSTEVRLVFPCLVALCSALLLTHSHGASDSQVQPELLPEASHVSIAILGVAGGWSRWLELRVPPQDRTRRVMSWLWPVCFLLVGVLLACYQGSS
jgi:copper resistance protein D